MKTLLINQHSIKPGKTNKYSIYIVKICTMKLCKEDKLRAGLHLMKCLLPVLHQTQLTGISQRSRLNSDIAHSCLKHLQTSQWYYGRLREARKRHQLCASAASHQPPFMSPLLSLLPPTPSASGGFNRPHELTDQSSRRSNSLFPHFPPEILPKSNLPNIEKTYTFF